MDRLLTVNATEPYAVETQATSKNWEAFAWGLLSASSLVFGSAIGIVRLPSKVTRAALMAFGGGALIEALSIELFAHIIALAKGGGSHGHGEEEEEEPGTDHGLVFLALSAALVGGLIFAALDRALSEHGAFLRKAATLHAYVGRLKYALTRRLIARLRLVPMFSVLPVQQLHQLARSTVRERYKAGAVIFSELDSDSSVFFLLSGRVELTLTTVYYSARKVAWSSPGDSNESDCSKEEDVVDQFLLGPNDIFGEMALLTGETMHAEAVALTRCCVLRIPSSVLHKLLASNRRMQDFVACTAVERLRGTQMLRRCNQSTVSRLVGFMQQAEYEPGDVLFEGVDALCPIYFVVLGAVEVTKGNASTGGAGGDNAEGCADAAAGGCRRQTRLVSANELCGTEHLVLGREDPNVNARALERTTALIIQRGDVDKLCARDEWFRQALMKTTTAVEHAQMDKVVPLSCSTSPFAISQVVPLSCSTPTATNQVTVRPPSRDGVLNIPGAQPSPCKAARLEEQMGWHRLETPNTLFIPGTGHGRSVSKESWRSRQGAIGHSLPFEEFCKDPSKERPASLEHGGFGHSRPGSKEKSGIGHGRMPSKESGISIRSGWCSTRDRGESPLFGGVPRLDLVGKFDHRPATPTMSHVEADAWEERSHMLGAAEAEEDLEKRSIVDANEPLDIIEDLADLEENAEAAKGAAGAAGAVFSPPAGHGHGGFQAAVMIWVGLLIDSVPESVVMGILANTASGSTLLTFVCGVFLANFPEAMSSAGTMRQYGMRRDIILTMWASIALLTGVGAFVGATLFPPGSDDDPGVIKAIVSIEGLCGGAMLCMIANTVLPEAFAQGGNVTGLSTLCGFLTAISISVIN